MRELLRRVVDRVTWGSITRWLQADPTLRRLLESEAGKAPRNEERHRSHRLGERVLSILARMTPEDPIGGDFVRLGRRYDGGYVLWTGALTGRIAYSFGIGDDVSWDLAMAERGYLIFQYDHTVDRPITFHPNFHFEKLGLGRGGDQTGSVHSLPQILERNEHATESGMVLKIDVEGTEWSILASLAPENLNGFDEIVIEFHDLDQLDRDDLFRDVVRSLELLNEVFVPVHVHANNYADFVVLGGVPLPPVIEVTYVRRSLVRTVPCSRLFPTALDQPNRPDRPDLFLGRFQFPR